MPTIADLDALRAHPEPDYPEYPELLVKAKHAAGRFANPARLDWYENVVREHGHHWCSAVLGYPYPGSLRMVTTVEAELLYAAHEAGLDPPMPRRVVVWMLQDAARRAELDEQRAAARARDEERSAAALAACRVPVEKRPNIRGRRLRYNDRREHLVHFAPTVDALSGRSRRHPRGRALCERPDRAKPRVLGEPVEDPATCVSCLRYAPKIRIA